MMDYTAKTEEEFEKQLTDNILRNHLSWTNADIEMPSGRVNYEMGEALNYYTGTLHDFDDLGISQAEARGMFDALYAQCARKADERWSAAVALLGL